MGYVGERTLSREQGLQKYRGEEDGLRFRFN